MLVVTRLIFSRTPESFVPTELHTEIGAGAKNLREEEIMHESEAILQQKKLLRRNSNLVNAITGAQTARCL